MRMIENEALGQTDLAYVNQRRKPGSFSRSDIVDFVETKASTSDRGRDPIQLAMQKQWFVNVAYFLGVQSFDTMEALVDIDPTFLPTDRGFQANHIQAMVMSQVARMTNSNPVYDVIPETPDPDDQFGAKAGDDFLSHFDDVVDFSQIRTQQMFWAVICGAGFVYSDWDAKAGPEMRAYSNPFDGSTRSSEGLNDEQIRFLEQNGGLMKRNEGDLVCEALAPFQVTVPQGFRSLKDMPWIVIEFERSLDWVWDRYPSAAKNITPEDLDTSVDGQYWRKLSSLVARQGFTLPAQGDEGNETIRVRELWVRPSGRFPDGLFARVLRRTYLEHGPHPYHDAGIDIRKEPWMGWPLSMASYRPVPGRFWPASMVEDLITPQIDYNRARHQAIQQRDKLAQAQWIKPKAVHVESYRNEYGDWIEYDGMQGKPEMVPPPPMSQMHVEAMERSLMDMRAIASQHEATQGDVPTGVRSGVAIRHLQERDVASLSTAVRSMESCWRENYTRILTLVHQFMDIPRAIQVYGEYRQADVAMFKGSDLHGNVQVRIRPGSMMPRSKAETAQMMLDMLQLGVLNPANPRDQEVIFDALEVGGAEKFFQERHLDRRRATIENHMFQKPRFDPLTGSVQPFPAVLDDDDHRVHLEQHMMLLKSDAYEKMPPIRKLRFESHLLDHKRALSEMLMAAQAMAPAGGGGSPPKPPGEASQPADRQDTPGSQESAA